MFFRTTSLTLRRSLLKATALCLLLCLSRNTSLVAADTAGIPQDPDEYLKAIDAGYLDHCHPLPPKDNNLPPDDFGSIYLARKRYRLVIAAGEFIDNPTENNLTFATPTARLVDKRLANLKFDPLPSRSGKAPYIAGADATLVLIQKALQEMSQITADNGFGIIYWVGHGDLRPGGQDLVLPVHDLPVGTGQGVSVRELVDTLIFTPWHQKDGVLELPHFLVVIDTCDSGTYLQRIEAVVTVDQVQHLVSLSPQQLPQQIAMISSTGSGTSTLGFPLQGTELSAFGAYFSRALQEDWTCADQNFDGVLSVQELGQHLQRELDIALHAGGIPVAMVPQYSGPLSFAAYSADDYRQWPGERVNLMKFSVNAAQPTGAWAASTIEGFEVRGEGRGGDLTISCGKPCNFVASKSLDTISVSRKLRSVFYGFGPVGPPEPPPPVSFAIGSISKGQSLSVAGISLTRNN